MTDETCSAYGSRYGLTCGFWTDDSEALDLHVFQFHADDPDVFDLDGAR